MVQILLEHFMIHILAYLWTYANKVFIPITIRSTKIEQITNIHKAPAKMTNNN